jgi:predicted porin
MKRELAVVGVATVLSIGVHAQSSVTLYGVADAGVEYLNHTPNASKQSSNLVRMTSGNIAGSRWGMKGVEDLGGGLKGVFVLEGGISLDSGSPGQGGRVFGRRAYVGIGSYYGELTIGRQNNLIYDLITGLDPMGLAPKYSAYSHDTWMTGRTDNAVKYAGKFGRLTAEALYSFGVDSMIANGSEVPGNSRVGREMSTGFTYDMGKVRIGGVFDQLNGTSVATASKTERRYVASMAGDIGSITAYLGYRRLVSELLVSMTRTDVFWVGANWKVDPAVMLTGAVYKTNDRTSSKDPMSVVLSADYRFSKRTDAYASASYTLNKGGSALSANGYDRAVIAGANQLGVILGLRHAF